MRLDEAKVILEENGYELLEEGKLCRALAAGALALGSLFGLSNAKLPTNINDLKNDSVYTEINIEEVPSNVKDNSYYTADKIYYDTEDDYYYAVKGDTIDVKSEGLPDIKVYFDKNGIRKYTKWLNEDEFGNYLVKVSFDKNGKAEKQIDYYDENGKELRTIDNYKTKTHVEYYPSGELKTECNLDNEGKLHGTLKMYYQNGKYAGEEKFIHGEYVEGSTKCKDGRHGGNALQCQIPLK